MAVSPVLSTASATVLVIDDDPAVRDFMTHFLASEGVQALSAADGEEGIRLAEQFLPRVIFLDLLMPRMDGWTVLNRLKAKPRLASIPVILLTLMNESEMGYILGASEYLAKPIERDRLASLLRKYRIPDLASQVLVIEDDAATRQVVRRTLIKQGWTVAEAENGRVGLERLAHHQPQLILLDLMMPEMDGFEFLGELRKHEEWRKIPVVILTSKDITPEDALRLTSNVEKILQKSAYTREALLREVKKIVAEYTANPTPIKKQADDMQAQKDEGSKRTPAAAGTPASPNKA